MKKMFDEKFKKFWPYYIGQTLMAMAVIFIITLLLGGEKVVVISSMGATAFICFAIPKSQPAQTINVLGGHIVGLAVGTVLTFFHLYLPLEYSLAVGVTMFLMVLFNVEHPPAAGTALAVTINEVNFSVALAILISSLIISQFRYFLRNRLKNLI